MAVRRIRVTDTDENPTEVPVGFRVEVSQETATDEDPASVRVTLTNQGDDMVELFTGHPGVFGTPTSEPYDPGLHLFQEGTTPGYDVNPDTDDPARYGIPGYLARIELAPGDSEVQTLDVRSSNPADPAGELPTGTFTFRAEYTCGDDSNDEEGFKWGFSLTVESAA